MAERDVAVQFLKELEERAAREAYVQEVRHAVRNIFQREKLKEWHAERS